MNIRNAYPYIYRYPRENVTNRSRSVVVEFSIMDSRNVPLSKPGLLLYSSMQFIDIVPYTLSPQKFQVLNPKPKWCCHAVVTHIPNNRPFVHADPVIGPEIHLDGAAVVLTGSPHALMAPSLTLNVFC